MHAERDNPSIPAWREDEQDSSNPSKVGAPYFDEALKAWVLTRHGDILAVLRHEGAVPTGVKSSDEGIRPADEALRIRLRAETQEALSPALLRQWQQSLQPELNRLLCALPVGEPVDVLASYARPLSLAFAALVTGISQETAAALCEHARRVSRHAADPYDERLRSPSHHSNAELQNNHFHAKCEALRDSTFVAISQTIPCMLGNAWYALLRHPAQWRLVHQDPACAEQAIEELMRYAGLTRILAREAIEDLDINGTVFRKGQRIILRIIAGNHDPERFINPDAVDVTRSAAGHLSLGAGPHSCAGASLIRMSLVTITRPLLQRFSSATLVRPVQWQGGAIFQSPQSLWITLAR